MRINADTVFFHIYFSIRGDCSSGVDERAIMLKNLLPHTTIKDKEAIKDHLNKIIKFWIINRDEFDGRHWVFLGKYPYHRFHKLVEDSVTLDVNWGIGENGTSIRPLEEFGGCHEDAVELYERWKRNIVNFEEKFRVEDHQY